MRKRYSVLIIVISFILNSCGSSTEIETNDIPAVKQLVVQKMKPVAKAPAAVTKASGKWEKNEVMMITSSAFQEGQMIPSVYTGDGEDISPPLGIQNVPDGAVSLVLIVDDPDAPVGTWDHWILWDIPPGTRDIPSAATEIGVTGRNSWGRLGYGGPAPPSGTHRYFFKLYVLDTMLDLEEGSPKSMLLSEMEGHVLAEAKLMGKYSR